MDDLKAVGEGPPWLLGEFRHQEDGLHQWESIVESAVVLLALCEVMLEEAAC
jgi:hypothetical protein